MLRLCRVLGSLRSLLPRFAHTHDYASPIRTDPVLSEMEAYSSKLVASLHDSRNTVPSGRSPEDGSPDSSRFHYAPPRRQLAPRNPSDSLIERVLPFSSDLPLRRAFLEPHHGPLAHFPNGTTGVLLDLENETHTVRIGRLFETIECVAVRSAYEHCQGLETDRPMAILCACVNRIDGLGSLSPHHDVGFEARCVATGKSTMKVLVRVTQDQDSKSAMTMTESEKIVVDDAGVEVVVMEKEKDDGDNYDDEDSSSSFVSDCLFTMVAREIDVDSAADVNPVVPESKEERKLWEMSQDSSSEIHQMMLDLVDIVRIRDAGSAPYRYRGDTDLRGRDMSLGKLRSVQTMSATTRNVFGKVYGGILLKECIYLARANASIFAQNSDVQFVALDDSAFLKPVFVGSIVSYTSHVVYAEEDALQVRVDVEVLDAVSNTSEITNACHVTFHTPNAGRGKGNPDILPRTQEEALMYMQGKMIHFKRENQKQLDFYRGEN